MRCSKKPAKDGHCTGDGLVSSSGPRRRPSSAMLVRPPWAGSCSPATATLPWFVPPGGSWPSICCTILFFHRPVLLPRGCHALLQGIQQLQHLHRFFRRRDPLPTGNLGLDQGRQLLGRVELAVFHLAGGRAKLQPVEMRVSPLHNSCQGGICHRYCPGSSHRAAPGQVSIARSGPGPILLDVKALGPRRDRQPGGAATGRHAHRLLRGFSLHSLVVAAEREGVLQYAGTLTLGLSPEIRARLGPPVMWLQPAVTPQPTA
jgi:hypothetical protein